MKHIEVVAAVIIRDNKVFATQRGYGEFKDWWEFPGGKQGPVCDHRGVGLPYLHLSMRCYLCSVISESLTLLEHEAAAWLDRDHLHSVKWLPADDVILDQIDKLLQA